MLFFLSQNKNFLLFLFIRFRRVHSLSALGTLKNVKDTLKEDKVRSIMEKDTTNNLFPKEFDDVLKADKGKKNLLAQ